MSLGSSRSGVSSAQVRPVFEYARSVAATEQAAGNDRIRPSIFGHGRTGRPLARRDDNFIDKAAAAILPVDIAFQPYERLSPRVYERLQTRGSPYSRRKVEGPSPLLDAARSRLESVPTALALALMRRTADDAVMSLERDSRDSAKQPDIQ